MRSAEYLGSLCCPFYSLFLAGVLAWAVSQWIPQGHVGSQLGLTGIYPLEDKLAPFPAPGDPAFHALFFGARGEALESTSDRAFEFIPYPAHELGELAVCLLRFAA